MTKKQYYQNIKESNDIMESHRLYRNKLCEELKVEHKLTEIELEAEYIAYCQNLKNEVIQ